MSETNSYVDEVGRLIEQIPVELVDFTRSRAEKSPPTQASSEFLTNREQGDWAETVLKTAINFIGKDFVAVKYGRGDTLVAGQVGFETFFEDYQVELRSIGKRPDLLVFRTADYDFDWGYDISLLPAEALANIVPNAIAGLEVRSSAFLVEKYEEDLKARIFEHKKRAKEVLQSLISLHRDAFNAHVFAALCTQDPAELLTLPTGVRLTKSPAGTAARALWEELKDIKKKLTTTRDFLSFTPKEEDLASVWRWVREYGVPHFYVQVFFDRVYGISLKHILTLLGDEANTSRRFYVERDVKNQGKTTFKINVKDGLEIAGKLDMPNHQSNRLDLPRGRLLFYVRFEGGQAFLNLGNIRTLLGSKNVE